MEWYISNGHSANLHVRLTSSDGLKVDFWIHGPVAADTSYSETLLFIGPPLCDVSAATGPCIQKSTFNQSEFVKCRNDCWTCILPLDIVSPCIVWNCFTEYCILVSFFWICAHFAQVIDCYHATLPVTGYRLLSFHWVGNQVPGFPKSAICFLTADSRVADERNMDCFSLFRDRHNFYWQELGDQLGN